MTKSDLRLVFAAAFTTALAVAIVVVARVPGRAQQEGPVADVEEGAEPEAKGRDEPVQRPPPPVAVTTTGERGEDLEEEVEAAELPPGAQTFGRVVFFPEERRILLEGRVCLDAPNADLEYFACFVGGKEYESVVAVRANAAHVNLAMLALRYRSGGGVKYVGDPRIPQGDPVIVEVEWRKDGGETVRARAEDLIWNKHTEKTMRRTAWLYTGSRMVRDEETGRYIYLAAVEGVMTACYRDPSAIFNSPLDTGADDVYYSLNRELCPPKGTPVKVIISPGKPEDVELSDLPEKE